MSAASELPGDGELAHSLAGYGEWLGIGPTDRAPLWVQRLRLNQDELQRFRGAVTPAGGAYVAQPVVPLPALGEPSTESSPGGPTVAQAVQRAQTQGHLHAFTYLSSQWEAPVPGYLHGVPFVVKDMIGVAGLQRTGGSASSDTSPLSEDSAAVARIKAQGALVLGLANLHELAFGASSANPVFGHVLNPLTPERIPGGSSGGSAAAVAAGIVNMALATDTGGSIRIPAACCGVAGFKGSYDAVPRDGVIDIAASLDHVGPIGRTVMDCARAFAALTQLPAFPGLPDNPLKGLRVSRLRGFFDDPLDPEVRAAVDGAADALAGDGARVVDVVLPGSELASAVYFVTVTSEAAAALSERLEKYAERLGEDVRVRLEIASFLPGHWYVKAQRIRQWLVQQMLMAFAEADVFLSPVMRTPAPHVGATKVRIGTHDYPLHTAVSNLTLPFSLGGMPAIALPWGRAKDGAALSVQIVGAPGHDWKVLQVAHRLEGLRVAGTLD